MEKIIRIGKGTFNDIIVDDESVLTEHCKIVCTGSKYRVINLNRDAKTFVNGEEINWEADITPDDELRVGTKVVQWIPILPSINIESVQETKKKLKWQGLLIVIIWLVLYFGFRILTIGCFWNPVVYFIAFIVTCVPVAILVFRIERKRRKLLTEAEIEKERKGNVTAIIIVSIILIIRLYLRYLFHH